MMKTITHFFTSGFPGVMSPVKSTSGGARHSRKLSAVLGFLLSMLILIPGSARAEGDDTNVFSYKVNETTNEVTITGLTQNATELNIPSEIDGKPVVEIGDYAFSGNVNILSVTIPSTVRRVGFSAFMSCKNLTSVSIAEGSQMTVISVRAFCQCGISSIDIPSSVLYISADAFSECSSLTDVNFADDSKLQSISLYAFESTEIRNITIPASVQHIGVDAFNISSLTSIEFMRVPIGKNSISDYNSKMFGSVCPKYVCVPEGCVEMYKDQLKLGDGVQVQYADIYADGLKYVINEAKDALVCSGFMRDVQKELQIPTDVYGCSVTDIGERAFAGTAIESVGIPYCINQIGEGAFADCASLTTVTLQRIAKGDNLSGYHLDMFSGCHALSVVKVPCGSEVLYQALLAENAGCVQGESIFDNGLKYNWNESKDALVCIGLTDDKMESVVIPSEVQGFPVVAIADKAFKGTDVKSLVVSSSILSIGDEAFADCASLSAATFGIVTFTGSIECYPSSMFSGCVGLSTINVPSGCEETYRSQLNLGDGVSVVGQEFAAEGFRYLLSEARDGFVCKGLSEGQNQEKAICIPSELYGYPVIAIGDEAFGNTAITGVTIPASVKVIGKKAFLSCIGLTSVSMADEGNLVTIGDEAFYNTAITDVTIPASVTEIGELAFYGYLLTTLKFADDSKLTTIGESAFCGACITSVDIPCSVTSIGECAFRWCYKLTSVNFSRIPMVGQGIEGYAENIFEGQKELSTITVPSGCEDTYKAQMSKYADFIQGKDIVGNSLKFGLNEAKDGLACIGLVEGQGDLTGVNIPAKVQGAPVTAIGENAFKNTELKNVSIPSSVKVIGYRAFYGAASLKNVTIADGSNLTTISEEAFTSCGSLESMVIPTSVETIGSRAFYAWDALVTMTFQRIPEGENGISGYSSDMLYDVQEHNPHLKYIFVPNGTVAAYTAQLSSDCSNMIMVDGGKVKLTDEIGFACEEKTLYRAGNLSYERSLQAVSEDVDETQPVVDEYATLCLPFSLNLSQTQGTFDKVYVPMNTLIHNLKESTPEVDRLILMLQEQEPDAVIPAGQPLFVKLKEGTESISLTNYEDALLTPALQPKTEAMTVVDWDGTSGLMTQNKQFSISYQGTLQPQEASAEAPLWTFNTDGTFGPKALGTTVLPFRLALTVKKESDADAGSGSEGSEGTDGTGSDGSGSEGSDGSEGDAPSASAKQLVISIGVSDGTTTGIRELIRVEGSAAGSAHSGNASDASAKKNGIIYDLNGSKVTTATSLGMKKLRKGIYILDGKKLIVK